MNVSVYLDIAPCHRIAAAVLAIHLGAIVCVLESAVPQSLASAAVGGLLVSLVRGLGSHCLRTAPGAFLVVARLAGGTWQAARRGAPRPCPLVLLAATALPGLIVLRVECPPGARPERIVALHSQIGRTAARRLRRVLGRDLSPGW